MPAVNRLELARAITKAFEELGWSAALLPSSSPNPRRLHAWREDGESLSVWMYVWTLTSGGRKNLPNEYRIQKTGVASPLPLNPDGETVIMGYEPNLKTFAGFDLRHHRSFTEGSPSAQIDIRAVRQALTSGLTFDRKSNDEIAVGVRSDQLLNYIRSADEIHQWSSNPNIYKSVESVALREIDERDIPQPDTVQRQRVIRKVSRLARIGNFRTAVLSAYDRRCAVTGLQLRVVQAAHILPVSAPGSADTIQNGIALSPTYHVAYDNGLIFLDNQFNMRLNERRLEDLRNDNLHGGHEHFTAPLGEIIKPVDSGQWPDPNLVEAANRYRGIVS